MFDLRPYNRRHAMEGYDPFREMQNFEEEFFDFPFLSFENGMLSEFKTDIVDNDKEYVLEADLPGFDKKDIKLDIGNNILTIRAERHSEHEEKDKKNKYVRCERSYGSYCRQFDISGVDENAIKAKYDQGVLKLTLPKKETPADTGRHLEIE